MCLTGTRKRIIRIKTFGIRKAMNPDNMRPDRTQAAVPAVLSARPDSLTVPRAASAFHCRPFLRPSSSACHSRLQPGLPGALPRRDDKTRQNATETKIRSRCGCPFKLFALRSASFASVQPPYLWSLFTPSVQLLPDDISGKFQFLSRYVTICHVLSSPTPLSSPDSKWTGPFSTRFCCHGVLSTTHFTKAGYANTRNSKWTERIDFFSILVHFEIGSVSHSSLLSLGQSARNFTPKKKNFGKEKVKFWMLYQPLTSIAAVMVKKR